MRALRILVNIERKLLGIFLKPFFGKKRALAIKGKLLLKTLTHLSPITYLTKVLSSAHFLTFTDGFRIIESAKHSNISSVIEEMRGCYLTARPGDVVIDVGANYGFYSLLSSRLAGTEGYVFAFEPETNNYHILLANLGINYITNVKTFKIGLGAVDGETNLYIGEHPGAHSTTFQISSKFETVKVKTLDSVFAELGTDKINLIKMDAEGAELDILRGGLKTISKYKPNLTIASYHYVNEAQEIERFLRDHLNFYYILKKINPGEGIIINAIFQS